MAESVSSTEPPDPLDNASSSSGRPAFSQPSLPYIALIAKVLLSSPSKKLGLASIYTAMEERFPHLRSRAPAWRNSVRHNLSVNDCFVKQGDFRRRTERRARRGRRRHKAPRRGTRGHHVTSAAWTHQRCAAWRVDAARARGSSWTGGGYLPGGCEAAAFVGRPPWNAALLGGTKGQHVSALATPPRQQLRFPVCCRFPPAVMELTRPPACKVNFSFHPRGAFKQHH
ncbi:uncharacterized protein AB9W97_012840 [Spinachia spinachia]